MPLAKRTKRGKQLPAISVGRKVRDITRSELGWGCFQGWRGKSPSGSVMDFAVVRFIGKSHDNLVRLENLDVPALTETVRRRAKESRAKRMAEDEAKMDLLMNRLNLTREEVIEALA